MPKDEYAVFCGISLIFIALYGVTLQYGLHESYQRAFMFGLIPLTYLCMSVLKSKPKLLVGVLAVLILLNIPAQYGSDSFRLATGPELAGSRFFAAFAPKNSSCFDEFSFYIRYYGPANNYTFETVVASAPSAASANSTYVSDVLSKVTYIVQSQLEDNYYIYYLGKNPISSGSLDRLNKIYSNEGFALYRNST
jgi:hypothetical protein